MVSLHNHIAAGNSKDSFFLFFYSLFSLNRQLFFKSNLIFFIAFFSNIVITRGGFSFIIWCSISFLSLDDLEVLFLFVSSFFFLQLQNDATANDRRKKMENCFVILNSMVRFKTIYCYAVLHLFRAQRGVVKHPLV